MLIHKTQAQCIAAGVILHQFFTRRISWERYLNYLWKYDLLNQVVPCWHGSFKKRFKYLAKFRALLEKLAPWYLSTLYSISSVEKYYVRERQCVMWNTGRNTDFVILQLRISMSMMLLLMTWDNVLSLNLSVLKERTVMVIIPIKRSIVKLLHIFISHFF